MAGLDGCCRKGRSGYAKRRGGLVKMSKGIGRDSCFIRQGNVYVSGKDLV